MREGMQVRKSSARNDRPAGNVGRLALRWEWSIRMLSGFCATKNVFDYQYPQRACFVTTRGLSSKCTKNKLLARTTSRWMIPFEWQKLSALRSSYR